VGLVGLGTVGTGVARILFEKAQLLEKRAGIPIRLKRIVDIDLNRDRGICLDGVTLSQNVEDILNDPSIDVLIELIGGIEPARSIVVKTLASGKHVVTANKALLAESGKELFQAATDGGVQLGFEASVAGGIPILRSLREGLASDQIQAMAGIINGTANYILSTMEKKGLDFSECLREAQEKGYAEADPTLDVEGQDTMHKLAILVALAHGIQIRPEDIFTEGIQHITLLDILNAEELGYCIKLLALAVVQDRELEVRVHPTLIPRDHMLSKVDGAFNAIYVTGEDTGPLMFYGQGAGMMPTGSAVVSDLLEIARTLQRGCRTGLSPLGFVEKASVPMKKRRMDDLVKKYYIRFPVLDRPGVLSRISGILGKYEISILSVIQHGREETGPVQIVMLTHEAREVDVQEALQEINGLDDTTGKGLLIRIEDSLGQHI